MAIKKTAKAKKVTKAKKTKKEKIIGKVDHVFDGINVVTMTLKNPLKVGDMIHIKGHTTDFVQKVESMQIEHKSVAKAKKDDGVGIKVNSQVRDSDTIYLADKKTLACTPLVPVGNISGSQGGQPGSGNAGHQSSSFSLRDGGRSKTSFNPILPEAAMPKIDIMRRSQQQLKKDSKPGFLNF